MAANFLLAILIAIFAVACLVQPNSKATVSSQSSQSSSQICASGVPTPNSDLVQFTVKVTDSSGKSITGLSEDSFRVTQSGQQMPLEFFEVSPPASIGLVIDTSGSMVGKLDQVRASGSQFIGGVNPSDDIFLFAFSGRPFLLQPFATDHALIISGLETVHAFGRTAMFDSTIDAVNVS
jgi:Ca-activated chloride channel family protein